VINTYLYFLAYARVAIFISFFPSLICLAKNPVISLCNFYLLFSLFLISQLSLPKHKLNLVATVSNRDRTYFIAKFPYFSFIVPFYWFCGSHSSGYARFYILGSPLNSNRSSSRTPRLHLLVAWSLAIYFLLMSCLANSSTLKMEASCSSICQLVLAI
jgi:hypothetical protein